MISRLLMAKDKSITSLTTILFGLLFESSAFKFIMLIKGKLILSGHYTSGIGMLMLTPGDLRIGLFLVVEADWVFVAGVTRRNSLNRAFNSINSTLTIINYVYTQSSIWYNLHKVFHIL